MMTSVSSGPGRRRLLATAVQDRLRGMNRQLTVLNHVVGRQLKLRDIDLDCLDLVAQHGTLGPSELARRAGVHPATMTGVLDRLQRAGWVERVRDPAAADRRGVTVRPRRERAGDVYRLYDGMRSSLADICADYSEQELELIGEFLGRVTAAGRVAVDDLSH